MIVLGVDWGRARTGVAVSDELGLLAHPLITLEEPSLEKLARSLSALARERGASEILLGLPVNMDGTEGDSAAAVRRLGERLAADGHAVVYRDERLTTWAAERLLSEDIGASAAKRKRAKDQMAACLILQNYLDAKPK
jgi:putative Holliday junction resolvase